MSQELEQYKDIIDQLIPLLGNADFNRALLQLTHHLAKEKRFLIKMEINRLTRPCLRAIDLRGQVDGECELYEFNNISHYLDAVAIRVFEEQVKIFGQYTFGVYEAVMQTENNFKVMRAKAEQAAEMGDETPVKKPVEPSANQFQTSIVQLFKYHQRVNERMNFAVAVNVTGENNNAQGGNSVDISTTGLRVKLAKQPIFSVGELVYVTFRGLDEDYTFDKNRGVAYRIVKINQQHDSYFLALQRDEAVPDPQFETFLENFIHGNKRRYKINMTNTIDAVINKSVEQNYSTTNLALPVFIEVKDRKAIPRFAMLNEVNRDVINYWNDEDDVNHLDLLFTRERLKSVIVKPKPLRELYVYSFTHVRDNKVFFYSASNEELEANPELKDVYLGFGARRASWRVFKLKVTDMDPNQAHVPLSIPDNIDSKIKRFNMPPAPRLMSKLINLRYIVHVSDVTTVVGQRIMYDYDFQRDSVAELKKFGHSRQASPHEIKVFRYKYDEKRLEPRYILRVHANIKTDYDAQEIIAISEDISVRGLRLELKTPFTGNVDDRIIVGFPKLQQLTVKHSVLNLNYRVVNIGTDGTIVHLRAIAGEEGLSARKFFEELIKDNKRKLVCIPDEEEIPGIGHALRCINARNPAAATLQVLKDGARLIPYGCVLGQHDNRIARLLTHNSAKGKVNVEFLFRDRLSERPFIQGTIKRSKVEKRPLTGELLIAFNPELKDPEAAIVVKFSKDFESPQERTAFIQESLKNGQFIAVHVLLLATGKPDLGLIQAELNYVSAYALHKAKDLENRLWNVVASVHLTDITAKVLFRHGYTKQQIDNNRDAI